MKSVDLNVLSRQEMTKNELKRLRDQGVVPAILYGHHMDKAVPLTFAVRDFSKLYSKHGKSVFLTLKSEDKNLNGKSALIKEVQKNTMTDVLTHVDLMEINQNEKIHVTVDFDFVGTPEAVKDKGAIVEIILRSLDIEC